jgi:hypothetical protein
MTIVLTTQYNREYKGQITVIRGIWRGTCPYLAVLRIGRFNPHLYFFIYNPITGLDRPIGFQPYAPAAFTPQEIFLVLISVRG